MITRYGIMWKPKSSPDTAYALNRWFGGKLDTYTDINEAFSDGCRHWNCNDYYVVELKGDEI